MSIWKCRGKCSVSWANGAGKTTTINMLIGLTKVDGGEITIFGKKVNGNREDVSKDIGIVPRNWQFMSLTAAENITFFGKLAAFRDPSSRSR